MYHLRALLLCALLLASCKTIAPSARCGDGVIDSGEACDDGNNQSGDGCESDCVDICSGVLPAAGTTVALKSFLQGVQGVTAMVAPPRDFSRLFLAQIFGKVLLMKDGQLQSDPFLDISTRVKAIGEEGFFSIALHPDFAKNGRFFVDYTDLNDDFILSEFRVDPQNPDRADPLSERQLLFIEHSSVTFHYGGGLLFGPDGFLYLSTGDGDSTGAPLRNAQNLGDLKGKLLRIDVDTPDPAGQRPYSIPPDNPFLNNANARPELWDFGFRNPWRFSFDRATGDLYLGDVGQNSFEEVDFEPAGQGGRNYGWSDVEGKDHCFPETATTCDNPEIIDPISEYSRESAQQLVSVIGGYVYRGCAFPGLRGTYFYGDFSTGFIRSLRVEKGAATEAQDLSALSPGNGTTTFAEDARGELYIIYGSGQIFQITAAP